MIINSTGAGFNTNGVTCLDWLESSKIESLPPEYIKGTHEFIGLTQLYRISLKSPLNQSDNKIITISNKLQSSSAERGASGRQAYMMVVDDSPVNDTGDSTKKAETQKQPVNLSTPDILQSSEVLYISISSVDTAGGPILSLPIPTCTPSAVTPVHIDKDMNIGV